MIGWFLFLFSNFIVWELRRKNFQTVVLFLSLQVSTVQIVQSPIHQGFTLIWDAERSEPSSRITLIGEQPNPWELLHPRDVMSRHRGAELRRRYGRLGGTSLLSPE